MKRCARAWAEKRKVHDLLVAKVEERNVGERRDSSRRTTTRTEVRRESVKMSKNEMKAKKARPEIRGYESVRIVDATATEEPSTLPRSSRRKVRGHDEDHSILSGLSL